MVDIIIKRTDNFYKYIKGGYAMYFKNEVIVEGRLVEKPEIKKNKNDKNYCNFTVCYNESHKVGEEWENIPHFFRCTAFGYEAENITSLEKGDAVSLLGKLVQKEWTDNEGKKHNITSIIAFHVRKFDISKKEKIEETPENSIENEIPSPEEEKEAFDVF